MYISKQESFAFLSLCEGGSVIQNVQCAVLKEVIASSRAKVSFAMLQKDPATNWCWETTSPFELSGRRAAHCLLESGP